MRVRVRQIFNDTDWLMGSQYHNTRISRAYLAEIPVLMIAFKKMLILDLFLIGVIIDFRFIQAQKIWLEALPKGHQFVFANN